MYAQRRALFAKGRMKKGERNKTENAYEQYLKLEQQSGRVAEYWFEGIKLKVADGQCWYTPDFLVLRPDGFLELHEVKGSPKIWMEDAKVKCKSVSTQYPFKLIAVYPRRKKDGGGWDFQEF